MTAFAALPAWGWMWSTAIVIYAVCKLASWSMRSVRAPLWKHIAYLLFWPGMDADTFLDTSATPVPAVRWREWLFAASKLALGIVLMRGIAPHWEWGGELGQGWVGMIGLVLALHFGVFHLLSCLGRTAGIHAVPLMDRPLLASSVAEFWGRRWNRAFRDLTHRFLFLPFRRTLGPVGALAVGFLVSGLVHEVVITVPSGGGYGLPTLYFALQAIGLLIERSRVGQAMGLGRGLIGRVFAVVVVAATCPLLFPPPFVLNVIRPFLMAMGMLS